MTLSRLAPLRLRALGATLTLLSAVMLVGASSASAGKGVVDQFGQGGSAPSTGAGEFTYPTGVAINQSTGDVYVVDVGFSDGGGQRLTQFDADGGFVRAWGWGVATGAEALEVCTTSCQSGIAGSGDGQFALQTQDPLSNLVTHPQVAVDQADGSVYLADTLNNRVQKFSGSGAYLDQFGGGQLNLPQGVAVDPVSGDVYVADTDNHVVQRYDSDGNHLSTIGTPGGGFDDGSFMAPRRLAVDSTGRLYVLDRDGDRVQRFTAGGAFDQVFAAGAYADPTDLAIDPASDHVYISGQSPDFTVHGIFEFDSDGTAIDTHATNTGLNSFDFPAGLAVRSATGRIYASSAGNVKAVLILDEVAPPTVSIDPVADVTATGATFSGTVNPQGPPNANYRFEYSTDGSEWTRVPASDVPVGVGNDAVPVSETVTGLEPNTDYRVRLVATRDYNAASATSAEESFTTAAAPPQVRALPAGGRSDGAAWLGAEVNPRNSQTSYYVEYTVASDVGYADSSRVPAAPSTTDVGDGNAYVTVTELATGLQPDTAYRFRIVAANQAGTTNGPDQTFTTRQATPAPPAGRGYEMVSPLDKNGADVERNMPTSPYSTSGAARAGDAVAYVAQGQFAGIGGGAPQGQYRSVRGPSGWTTRGLNPPVESSPEAEAVTPWVWGLSDDLSRAVVSTNKLMTPDAWSLGGSWGLYLQDNGDPAASSYTLLSVPASPLPQEPPIGQGSHPQGRFKLAGATDDYGHIALNGEDRPLTADAPTSGGGLYIWSDGQLRLVSLLPSGDPAAAPGLGGGGTGNTVGQSYPGDHPVSDDGQRVFWSTFGEPGLYVRDGVTTTPLSVSERDGDPASPAGGKFQAAKADDGSLALFTSPYRLTDDATAQGGSCDPDGTVEVCHADLYLWDATAPEGSRLTDLTTDDPDGGGVAGLAAATDDLSRVFFVAGGALTEDAVDGSPNLYAWSPDSGLNHVAVLIDQDVPVWGIERDARFRQYRDARISADGDRFLFASRARLTATDNDGRRQVYLYDAPSDRLTCVSCHQDGRSADGDAWLFYPTDLGPSPTVDSPTAPTRLPRNLSADGSRAFFETTQSLVPRDVNGKADVYMWSAGELSLISSGSSSERSELIDASESGDDVFFTTRERLVASDVDDQVDVYDARVGGGFAEQQLPPECVGDQCQGGFSAPPLAPGLASTRLDGRGDVARTLRASFALRGISAGMRARLARGQRVTLRVRVSRAGVVRLVARARISGRSRVVARASKRVSKPGVVALGIRLSRPARRQLAQGRRLRMSLAARLGGGGTRSLQLNLRRADR